MGHGRYTNIAVAKSTCPKPQIGAAVALTLAVDGVARAPQVADLARALPGARQIARDPRIARVAGARPRVPVALITRAVAAADAGLQLRGHPRDVPQAEPLALGPEAEGLAHAARHALPVPVGRVAGARAHAGARRPIGAGAAGIADLWSQGEGFWALGVPSQSEEGLMGPTDCLYGEARHGRT